jgi:hypothetical protein
MVLLYVRCWTKAPQYRQRSRTNKSCWHTERGEIVDKVCRLHSCDGFKKVRYFIHGFPFLSKLTPWQPLSFLLKWSDHFSSYESEGLSIKYVLSFFRISSLLLLSNLVYSLTFLRHFISAAGILLKICTFLHHFHFLIVVWKLSLFIKLCVCLSSFLLDLMSNIVHHTNVYTCYLVCINLYCM